MRVFFHVVLPKEPFPVAVARAVSANGKRGVVGADGHNNTELTSTSTQRMREPSTDLVGKATRGHEANFLPQAIPERGLRLFASRQGTEHNLGRLLRS